MATLRMDNVAIVVEDLDAAIDFFTELGLTPDGRAEIEGAFADACTGLDGVRSEIAMMRTPDGSGRLELTAYHRSALIRAEPTAPNTLGFHRVMFEVEDLDDTLDRLGRLGGHLVGQVANFDDVYLLCYLRGPGGFVIGLAQRV
jgi:catechol 2,3-dioxygenase-like lactoylglutathione lyase family enzyme